MDEQILLRFSKTGCREMRHGKFQLAKRLFVHLLIYLFPSIKEEDRETDGPFLSPIFAVYGHKANQQIPTAIKEERLVGTSTANPLQALAKPPPLPAQPCPSGLFGNKALKQFCARGF